MSGSDICNVQFVPFRDVSLTTAFCMELMAEARATASDRELEMHTEDGKATRSSHIPTCNCLPRLVYTREIGFSLSEPLYLVFTL